MSNRHSAAREAAQAVDTVINQMQGGTQKPNPADVLVANVAVHAAARAGATAEGIARYRTT